MTAMRARLKTGMNGLRHRLRAEATEPTNNLNPPSSIHDPTIYLLKTPLHPRPPVFRQDGGGWFEGCQRAGMERGLRAGNQAAGNGGLIRLGKSQACWQIRGNRHGNVVIKGRWMGIRCPNVNRSTLT